jgi:5-methyltetrahydrofolate--homocysteine methyltransferase
VVSALLDPRGRDDFHLRTADEYAELRSRHASAPAGRPALSLAEARARALATDWAGAALEAPAFTGTRVLDELPLGELAELIDWTPFFRVWELRGAYPRILDDPVVGPRAREVLADARSLLDEIVADRLLTARGVYGFWPALAEGDDILVFAPGRPPSERQSRNGNGRKDPLATLHTLRQQQAKAPGQPQLALADFVAPRSAGRTDHVGAFAVTAGLGLEGLLERFAARLDDYGAILAQALADRLAEAAAEWLHRRARREWYAPGEDLTVEDLIRERYRGIRPAPGYPAQPDHTEKLTLWRLLDAESQTGIRLTESLAMWPAASVSGLYLGHPGAGYFAVGRLEADQVADYARRKGWTLAEAERWLGPNLGYGPAPESAALTTLETAPAR